MASPQRSRDFEEMFATLPQPSFGKPARKLSKRDWRAPKCWWTHGVAGSRISNFDFSRNSRHRSPPAKSTSAASGSGT